MRVASESSSQMLQAGAEHKPDLGEERRLRKQKLGGGFGASDSSCMEKMLAVRNTEN